MNSKTDNKLKANEAMLRDKFMLEQVWMMCWNASVQRGNLYRNNCDEREKKKFRKELIQFITINIIPAYEKALVNEERHYSHLERIIDRANQLGHTVLKSPGYKAGVAQKLLNLALKYYWCLGKITQPPHCPIDSIILHEAGINDVSWINIFSINEYKKVIERVKIEIGDNDLSPWELENYHPN